MNTLIELIFICRPHHRFDIGCGVDRDRYILF